MKKTLLKSLTSVFFLLPFASFGQFAPKYFAFKDVSIIDGVSTSVLAHQTILIRGNKIEKVGPSTSTAIPDSCITFQLSGKFVIPGLIDTHVHLATEPSGGDNRAKIEKELKAILLSGITSVRDMAGDARSLAALSRDALTGDITAPDIYYSALMAGPSFFNDIRTHMSSKGAVAGQVPFLQAITYATDLTLAVAKAKGTGAAGIKLYTQLDGELAKKITTEAHRQGMLVWSHADLVLANPLEVINAGINSISHVGRFTSWPSGKVPEAWLKPNLSESFWDAAFKTIPAEEYVKAMLQHKTILDATLFLYTEILTYPSVNEEMKIRTIADREIGKRFIKLAFSSGVPVCTGTDLGDKRFVQQEIKALVNQCGFTPMQALISATKHGAMALGIEDKTGTIQQGKTANLVVLSANPAEQIDHLDKVEWVIKNGQIFNK